MVEIGDVFQDGFGTKVMITEVDNKFVAYRWLNGTKDKDVDTIEGFLNWFKVDFNSELERL
jgi:hypothetical protein